MSGPAPIPLAERIHRYFTPTEGCWEWTGARHDGYGAIGVGGRKVLAHRAVYEVLRGPVSEGLELDHLCRNRACVNPAHLEPVTHRENCLRGPSPNMALAREARCKRGHETSGANLYYERRGNGALRPRCRECSRIRSRHQRQPKSVTLPLPQ